MPEMIKMEIATAQDALKKYFGYDSFRPMQSEIIQAVYDKKDALVLMPTGGGKSVCFQIPAVTMPGTCVVISPLISLMKDQVESLKVNGINAVFLNSSLSAAEQRAVEDELYQGTVQLLYVSPEKICSQGFVALLKQTSINLFAIDEAHCVSQWGHDFRPEYAQLAFLKRQFKDVPVIALTATADKLTRKDIIRQLGLSDPEVFIASFDRPNLSLEVRPGQKRLEQLLSFLAKRPKQSGIVYCLSRKSTEQVAAKLLANGYKAAFYHAGLKAKERSKVQEDFINDDMPIVCATIAFGMGIDKSNVRWVVHYNMPKNIEGYYQEIGRAGRDGAKADTLLFYSFRDVTVLKDFITEGDVGEEQKEIRLAKLERMREYADAMICRRKILLNYFNENLQENCGNCDVCKNPPSYFDGTVIAQKALSAITRLGESVGITMLIDVLRGSRRRELLEQRFHQIKTYGIGADISFYDWQHILRQLLNLGFIDIAMDQKHVLKLTPASKGVLFGNQKVQLVKMADIKERMATKKTKLKAPTQRQRVRDELFEVLRTLRLKIARKKSLPPYIIFTDATIEEMAAVKPTTMSEMAGISGVGETKLRLYAKAFIEAIEDFLGNKAMEGIKLTGSTKSLTYELYRRGFSADQIAVERKVKFEVVIGQLIELYSEGKDIELKRFVSTTEIKKVLNALQVLPEPYQLKDIYDFLKGKVDYHKIRFAMGYYHRHVE